MAAVKRITDFSTVIGIALAATLIVLAISLGGSPKSFLDSPSALIVIGGTLAVTLACFTFREFVRLPGLVFRTIVYPAENPILVGKSLLELAEEARKNGVLALQNRLGSGSPFLRKGLQMIVDGIEPEKAEKILRQDVQSTLERHGKGVAILRKAAEVSPAMGLIGTLIGLVQMLGNLDDPSSIGPAMAVALLTTLYGAALSYVVFSPLAAKLERNTRAELLVNNMYMKGIIAIARRENPRQLEMLLNTILPPASRLQYFN